MMAVLYVILLIPGFVDDTISLSEAATEVSRLDKTITDTSIDILSTTMAQGSNLFFFDIQNVGTGKLWNFEKFNIFITYEGITSGQITESLTYAGDCSGPPAAGNWCKFSISGDLQDPDILNEDETMTIGSRVSETISPGIGIIVLSTDNGIVDTFATTT